jgi:hypothetical protein
MLGALAGAVSIVRLIRVDLDIRRDTLTQYESVDKLCDGRNLAGWRGTVAVVAIDDEPEPVSDAKRVIDLLNGP